MMRQLVLTAKFRRSFRKFVKRDSKLQNRIETTLIQMQQDVFAVTLSTHKLTGKLQSLYACSCGYDCRIIFSLEKDPLTEDDVILLLDVGSHDEVY
jgi:mRNA interferase YafQ